MSPPGRPKGEFRSAQHEGTLMTHAAPGLVRRWVAYSVALAALGGVFLLYLQPDFLVTVAQQVWACF
jgi:hypothetical protein